MAPQHCVRDENKCVWQEMEWNWTENDLLGKKIAFCMKNKCTKLGVMGVLRFDFGREVPLKFESRPIDIQLLREKVTHLSYTNPWFWAKS